MDVVPLADTITRAQHHRESGWPHIAAVSQKEAADKAQVRGLLVFKSLLRACILKYEYHKRKVEKLFQIKET